MGHHRHHGDDSSEFETARKNAERSRREKETKGRFTLPEGRTVFRILKTPSDKERNSPILYIEYKMHNNVGPNKRYLRCGNDGPETKNCWGDNKRAKLEDT